MPSGPLSQDGAPLGGAVGRYRPAIDGLRGFAILAVVLFHLNGALLPGGFLGVDVFFVISGYLITSILARDLALGRFSLGKFYQRRIARLLPVYATVSLATLAGAALVYAPRDLASCGLTVVATSLSVANLKFMLMGKYFVVSPDAQPLVHFWSLSVEEQFYAFFPLLMLLLSLRGGRYRRIALVGLFVLSLWACVALTRTHPAWAFYLLPTRAWELLAGSLLALWRLEVPGRSLPGWTATFGLGAMLLSALLINAGSGVPGFITLVPVLGAALVLGAGEGLVEPVLAWGPLTALGRMSYSLYLWHWPIFSLIDYRFYAWPSAPRVAVKLGLSLLAGALSYAWLERPGRRFLNQPTKRRWAFSLLAVSLLVLVPLGLLTQHLNYYIDPTLKDVAKGGLVFNAGSRKGTLMLMGDSNGSMYARTLLKVANRLDDRFVCISVAGADPLPNAPGAYFPRSHPDAGLWKDSLSAVKSVRPNCLFLICFWGAKIRVDPGRLQRAITRLKPYVGRIVLITEPPQLPPGASREGMRDGGRPPFYEEPSKRDPRLAADTVVFACRGPKVSIIDMDDFLLGRDGRIYNSDRQGHMYYNDDGTHLSDFGADLAMESMLQCAREATAR